MALINSIFPRDRRVQAMGWWSLVMAGGPVLGVVAGGPVVEAFGWRWIFAAQVPMTLAGFALAAAILPETARQPRVAFDWRGALTLGLGVTGLLLALNRAPVLGWSSPWVVGGLVAAPVLIAAFFAVERRAASPLIPIAYLGRRNFSFPILVQFCTNFAYMGSFILTPLLLQDVLDYSTTKTGLLSIARPLSFAVTGPIAGYLAVKIGERASAVGGAALVVAAMIVMSAMAASIANAVDEHDLGVAGAAQQMVAQVGVVAGIQIMQTVQQARADDVGVVASYGDGFLAGAVVAVLGVVAAAFVRSSSHSSTEAKMEEAPPEERPFETRTAEVGLTTTR
jgi:MFS family permease